MYVNAYYTTYDCNITGTYCSYGDWFVEFSQLFPVVSQLFLTYFLKISQLFHISYLFPLASHLFLNLSHCFPSISHLFLKYFSLVSQVFLG